MRPALPTFPPGFPAGLATLAVIQAAALLAPAAAHAQWSFTDVTVQAGVAVSHNMDNVSSSVRKTSGGAACGDYNNDGWIDVYFLRGNLNSNSLFRNNGDGTFTDVAVAAGLSQAGSIGTGATFADWNGDGWLDLFVGGVETTNRKLFRNDANGLFSDVTSASGVWVTNDVFSATFGDLDNDLDLDLLLAHWNEPSGPGHVWLNDGLGVFTEADTAVGYLGYGDIFGKDLTFAFNVADINSDGWMDMLVAADFNTSHIFTNDGDGTFTETTDDLVITDDNGMGAAVADYDKDGDLDWFVTSIDDGTAGHDGNRLYQNDGMGAFADVTDSAGVRGGLYGWAASFQDLNNDGWLDIYHVNGWTTPNFVSDSSRCFVSDGDGTFTEMASPLGIAHVGQGRGTCLFDYDRDGDIDIFVATMNEQCHLYRNDGGNANNWLDIKLLGLPPNTEAIGGRILVTVGGSPQMWEMRCASNFDSQDPAEAHFGLGGSLTADVLVEWPDGQTTTMNGVGANQRLLVPHPGVSAPATGPRAPTTIALLGAAPNPFDSATRIRFSLSEPTRAGVRIYDTAGRLVRTLSEEVRGAGLHAVAWDGRDDSGKTVASGVYHVEVRTPGERVTGRIAHVR